MHRAPPALDLPVALAGLLACAVPPLLAYGLPPSATLLAQCVTVALWGVWALWVPANGLYGGTLPLLAALQLLGLGIVASFTVGGLPVSLGWSALGLVLCAAVVLQGTAQATHRGQAGAVGTALMVGLAMAGVLSAAVALVQVFAPGWADDNWIAHSTLPGRAVGNLRQPNHLCTVLLWGLVATVALHELKRLPARAMAAAAALLVLAVELSASRTGAVGLGLLLLWGLLDRRLSRPARWVLVATPLLYALFYAAMVWYADFTQAAALGAAARVETQGIGETHSPNSRLNIWRNALALLAAQPWRGVGFGEFNFAWSLTAFDGRPTAFFDHTHNLALQLLVELGWPLGGAVLVLIGWALLRGLRRSWGAEGDAGAVGRAAMVVVLLATLHSMVEYPWWYAYFLLPTAAAWGLALGLPTPQARGHAGLGGLGAGQAPLARHTLLGLLLAGVMTAGGVFAVRDYLQVVAIYAPADDAGPLSQRMVRGQRSVFFAHQADYATATNTAPVSAKALAFARAPHALLDTRMMVAWAHYLAGQGEEDKARWLAARLKEFGHRDAEAFFAPCTSGQSPPPFQCQAPQQQHSWREFMPGHGSGPDAAASR